MLNVEAGLEESGDGVSSINHTIKSFFYNTRLKYSARNVFLHQSVKEVKNLIGNEMIP